MRDVAAPACGLHHARSHSDGSCALARAVVGAMQPRPRGGAQLHGSRFTSKSCRAARRWSRRSPMPFNSTVFFAAMSIVLLITMGRVVADASAPGVAPVMTRRCRGTDVRLGLIKAREAALPEFRIGDRPALLSHSRCAESVVRLQQPLVMLAVDHVLLRRPGRRHIARVDYRGMLHHNRPSRRLRRRDRRDRRQASDQKRQTCCPLDHHNRRPFARLRSVNNARALSFPSQLATKASVPGAWSYLDIELDWLSERRNCGPASAIACPLNLPAESVLDARLADRS
jgi:hypothetical protein